MKKIIYSLIVLVWIVGTGGCIWVDSEDSGDDYFYYADAEYMERLKKELDAKSFKYSVDDKGYIRFSSEDKALFYAIEGSVGHRFDFDFLWDGFGKTVDTRLGFNTTDKEYMKVLMEELDSEGIKHSLDEKGFIRYSSKDETGFKDIQALVTAMVSGKRGMGPMAGGIDHDFLKALKEELDSAGVGYSINDKATVRCVSGDKQVFKNILHKLHKMHHLGDAARFFKEEKRKRLILFLEGKKIDHLILTNSHGTWVRWYPENKAQRDEIWSVVNSLGCGRSSIDKKESKGVSPSKETSQTVLVQQMCSTLPEEEIRRKLEELPCQKKDNKKTKDNKVSSQITPSQIALKQNVDKSCSS
ncbi:MAG: hypothetical protein OEZ51_03285 [Nitrospinota bacterium]|nr:hypothetical protein [Nitrospinota bacterium]